MHFRKFSTTFDLDAEVSFAKRADPERRVDMGYATFETRELAKRARAELSTPELLLWDELRGKRLDGLKFRRKHAMFTFVLDFSCAARRLCVQLGDVDPLLERKLHFIRVHIVRVRDPSVLLSDAGLAAALAEIRAVTGVGGTGILPVTSSPGPE